MRETTNRFVSKHPATVLQSKFLNLKIDSKKLFILPLFILMIIFAQQSFGQTNANYTFATNATASLTDMSTGTTELSLASATLPNAVYHDDDATPVTVFSAATPFPIYFMGVAYDRFSMNSNGQMRLGSTVILGTNYAGSATLANGPILAPLAGDNAIQTNGKVHYKITGTTPNRIAILEWNSLRVPFSSTLGTGSQMQVRLYESTGVVEYVYGAMYNNATSATTRAVGWTAGTTATTNTFITTIAGTPTNNYATGATWTTTSFTASANMTNLHGAADGSRRIFSWTPSVTPAVPTSLTFTNVDFTSMTLNWNDASTNEYNFAVYNSSDGGTTWNYVGNTASTTTAATGGAYTFNATGLLINTSYQWRVYAVSEGKYSTALAATQATAACGTYTGTMQVGPSGGATFPTLTKAISSLITCGYTGNIILELQSTYTSAGETFPLTFSTTLLSSISKTITIRPASGATALSISSANATATININGGKYITFDGRPGGTGTTPQLTIANTNTGAGAAIQYINDATNNTIQYCNVSAQYGAATSGAILFSTTTGTTGNDNNTITNNNIFGSSSANTIYNGICSVGSTTTTTLNNSGISVTNNNIYDYFNTGAGALAGINLNAGSTDWTITGNSFYSTAARAGSSSCTAYGIWVQTGSNYTITGNYVGGSAASCGGAAWTVNGTAVTYRFVGIGLTQSTTTASSVQNNTISNISWLSSSGAATVPGIICGIYVTGTSTSANIGNTTGNIINNISCQSSGTGAISYGIASSATGTINISNNTISGITVTGSSTSVSHGFVGISNSGGTVTISGNTVGSRVTSNSINASTASTNASFQRVSGIENSSTGAAIITNNSIANLNNAYLGTTTTATGIAGIITSGSTANAVSVSNNAIFNLSTSNAPAATYSAFGIYCTSTGGNTISQDTIYNIYNSNNSTATYSAFVAGIYYAGGTGTNNIRRNYIYNIYPSSTNAIAIQAVGIHIATGTSTYANNMIRLGYNNAGSSVTGGYGFVGIYEALAATNINNIYHNSVYIGGTGVGSSINTFAFNSANTTQTRNFQNNIFVNARSNGAGTGKHYAITVAGTAANPTGLTINYNDYLTSGTGGVFGLFNATDVANIGAWRTAVGQDVNSVSSDPLYISPTATPPDLHININGSSPCEATGLAIGAVSDDFDGQTRSGLTPTDIGADAFVAVPACPTSPNPADLATGVSQTTLLSWTAGTNATSYDVYFGTDNPPTNIVNGTNQSGTTYTPASALSASTTYYWQIVSRNSAGTATGCSVWSFTTQAAAPSLTTSSLTTFSNQCLNVASTAKTFTMNAINLTGTDVTITAPTDFTVSEDGVTYASSINVNHSSGSFSSKTIYVKFTPVSLGSYSDNIVISGGGLSSSVNVAVSGTGINNVSGLSYTASTVTYCTATVITANSATLATSGGTVTYSVSPSLPAGLSLNTGTGQITGNPTTATAAANYVITASNGCSSTTATVNITILTKLSALTYTTSPLTVCVGNTVNNTVSGITGSGTITYSVSPTLPAGLSINSATGAITGTASAATASASYTITADNGCSTTTVAVTITVNSSLNGTYTVGAGGSRDFATLTAAVTAYNNSCLTGPVVFNLMDATYSGSETFPITINANTSASSTNTLTIKPNTTATVSGSSTAGLIRLSGADYIIIDGSNSGGTDKSLTITNTNTVASVAAVSLISLGTGAGATNNTVKNCNISTGGTANAGYGIAIGTTPGVSGADNDNNTIQNNTITTSSVGIYAVGTASASSGGNDNLTITGNTISSTTSVANIGIQVGNGLSSTISLNTISVENSSTTAPVAISLETGFVSSTVTRNTITKSLASNTGGYGGRGITIGTGTASSALIISNNFVAGVNGSNWSTFGSSSSMGIAIGIIGGSSTLTTTAGGITLNYNTVNMSGTYSSTTACLTTALYVGSGASALSIQNNIFVNSLNNTGTGTTSKAYSIYSAVANTAYTTINYNDYYISGTQGVLGFLTSDRTNLAAIVTGFGGNANSQNIAPVFTSSTDLHLVYSNNTSLDDLGTTLITGYNIDIDGETRPASGSTNTDIGADEFAAIANDAGITGLVSSAFCPGSQTVQAVIKNFGTATLTSATVNWTVNGVAQASASWTGSLATGATGTVTLGTYTFVGATSYVIAVTSSLPNGVTDPNPGNNTFTSSSFQTALSGTYTVGAGGNYTTLTAAVAAANANGICGPTIFSLTDATYSGETFPIVINSLSGANAVNTLTIKPASGVNATISGSNAAAIIKLNGADYIIIDGSNNGTSTKNLTIANTNTGTSSTVIWLASVASPANGATNNTVKNIIITGQAPTTTFAGIVTSGSTVGAVAESANSSNTISNNTITAAQYGIGVSGVVGNESDNIVTNNTIGSATAGSKIGYRGIYIANQQNATVTGNNILGVVTSTTNTASGIYVGGTISGGTVSQNKITDVKNTNTTGYGSNGILLYSTSTAANLLVSNNFVSDVASYGYTLSVGVGDNGYGIVIDNSGGGYKIYHNTINLTTNQTTGTSAAINIVTAASASLDIRNNIFANSQTTNTRYAIYSGAANTVFSNIDYNDYYSAGTLGYISSARATLAAIQTGFGSNTNSQNITPVFTSSTDLHLIAGSNASLDDLGSTALLGTVATDIDAETRPASGSTNPDMGADEFVRPANDAGITGLVSTAFCPGSQSVQAVLRNYGTATLTSATINWTVNGIAQTPVSWTGSLATNTTANVTLGSYTFLASTAYVIVATASLPNGVADPVASNDTYTSPSFQTALNGTYTVGAAGNYTTLTAAVAAANAYGICGPTIFNLIDATYSGSETFPIVINSLSGASAVNTLTIKPASGNTASISGSNAAAIIKLNGADYITIDGSNNGTTSRNLTISNSNTGTSSAVVWLASVASPADGATNNTVKNVNLNGNASNTTFACLVSSGSAIGTVAEAANTSNTFNNNTANTSFYGIAMVGVTGNESGNSITNNIIGSATTANKIGVQGIFISQQQNIQVSGNTIFGVSSSTNINTAGIYVTGTISGGSISKNIISDVKNSAGAGRPAFGIWLTSSSTAIGLTVSNNFVSDVANSGGFATLARGSHGIAVMTGGGYNIYYNSVLLNTNPTGSTGVNAALYVASGVTTLDIRNNIFSNAQTLGNRYAIYSDAANTAFTTINYNDYACTGAALGYIGSARTGISDIVSGFGQNANSVSITPVFTGGADLHIIPSSNPLLDNLGTAIGSITSDIDGDVRSGTTPDMGADEFVTPACSVANGGTVVYSGSPICNSGAATLTASGYSYGSGTTYQWLVSTDNFVSDISNVSGGTSPSSVTSAVLTATSYFKLRVVCGTTVDTAYSNVVTVTVNNPSVTSATDNISCSAGSMTLSAVGSSGTTLNWYSAQTGGTFLGSGTTYTTPSISVSTDYYVEATLPSGSSAVNIGAGATTGTAASENPANGLYGGMKGQYLFTAAELTAAGLSAGNISNIALEFTAAGSALSGFTIQIGNTSLTTFATPVSIQGGLTTVYSPATFTPTVGVNSFALSPSFFWNGSSNIIVSTSWSNNNTSNTSSTVKYDATTNYASQSYRVDNETSTNILTFTGSTSSATSYTFDRDTYRPKMRFTGQVSCSSSPRTLVRAIISAPVANPTVSPLPVISICQDSIITLTASGSTPAPTTILYEGFEGTTFPPSTFDFTSNGDGDYFRSSSYYYEGSKAAGLYSETDYWDWLLGLGGSAGNVTMTQVTAKDLTNYSNVKLSFYHICATEDGFDFGRVQYNRNDGNGWQDFPASAYTGSAVLADANGNNSTTDQVAFDKASYSDWDAAFSDDLYDYLDFVATGYDPGNSSSLWKRETIDLTPYASNSFRIRFRMTFDDITDYYGWLIDSVAIVGTQAVKYAWSPKTALYINAGATTAYDSITNPDQPTVYAKPNDTTTYRAIAYIGSSPNSCSGVTPLTVNVSKKPTATIEAAKPFLCDATAELSASAVVPPSSTLNWTKASGTGSASATGNPATVSGLAGTTVYDVKGTNGVCVDIPIGTSTVVLPATDNSNIATSPSAGVSVCNYCVYADGNTKTYYNSTDGKIIAAITDETSNSASLGETEICFKVEGSVQSVTDNLLNLQPYLQRVWTIHPASGSRATVTLYFTGAELAALQAAANSGAYQFSGYSALGITKYSNGGTTFTPNYTAPASTGGVSVPVTFNSFNGTDHQVQFTVDDFSTFYIHPLLYPNSALPVELVSFTGWNAGEINQLEWKTASELNTLKFVVEKRIDGGNFTYLGELPAAGNSSQLLTYNLSDLNPVVGNNYYRLKMIDKDGKFSYSNIINIPLSEVLTNNFVSVFPNPTGGKLNVGIQSTSAYDTKVTVYDIIGTKMFEQNKGLIKGLNTIQFDFTSFAKGAYILHFTDNSGKTHTTKFVKD